MLDTLLLRPSLHFTQLHFTPLHYTTRHSFKLHPTTLLYPLFGLNLLHFTSHHYTSPHFTSLHFQTIFATLLSLSLHSLVVRVISISFQLALATVQTFRLSHQSLCIYVNMLEIRRYHMMMVIQSNGYSSVTHISAVYI